MFFKMSWDDANGIYDVLTKFQVYANDINNACDAEGDSYDAMLLLTGRVDSLAGSGEREKVLSSVKHLINLGGIAGIASIGKLCTM